MSVKVPEKLRNIPLFKFLRVKKNSFGYFVPLLVHAIEFILKKLNNSKYLNFITGLIEIDIKIYIYLELQ